MSLVSFGIGGVIPKTAAQTLHDRYGDCKDKAVLLSALLEAESFNASLVLVSPDRDVDPTFASPWPFDHIITMLKLRGENIWMDPSSGDTPFQTLPNHCGVNELSLSHLLATRTSLPPCVGQSSSVSIMCRVAALVRMK